MKSTKNSRNKIIDVIGLYEKGYSISEIQAMYHMRSSFDFDYYIALHKKEDILSMKNKGMSVEAVAKTMRLSENAVRSVFRMKEC